MTPFFCLKKVTYTSQPKNSQWCWAACLANFIKYYELDSEIGKSQCHLVSYYKKYLIDKGYEVENENTECCPENVTNGCNIGMNDEHFEHVINKVGLQCDVRGNKNLLESFDYIVDALKTNKCPIILKTNKSFAHDIMVVGFGRFNDCEYVLVSNPSSSYGEQYLSYSKFQELSQYVERFWVLKGLKNTTNLKIGEVLVNDSLINENHIASFNSVDKAIVGCIPSIPRSIISTQNGEGTIKQMFLQQNWNNSIIIRDGKMYINDYSFYGNYRLKKGKLMVKPILFPGDYSLKNEWMDYEDLQSKLLSAPKTNKFFIN